MSKNFPELIIDDDTVQQEAENCLERELTAEELDQVFETLYDGWVELVQDKIREVIDFKEMLERNKDASEQFPHFKVYHRNENAYQPEFSQASCFKTEEDARAYVHHDFITEFDEWKIFRVDGGEMREIWSINCDRPRK